MAAGATNAEGKPIGIRQTGGLARDAAVSACANRRRSAAAVGSGAIRKGGAALCEYLGKYLEKGFMYRRHEWKGARRVELSRRHASEWKRCSRIFAWHSPGAQKWRHRVSLVASTLGLKDYDELRRVLGPRWAYQLRGAMVIGTDQELREQVALLAAQRIHRTRL